MLEFVRIALYFVAESCNLFVCFYFYLYGLLCLVYQFLDVGLFPFFVRLIKLVSLFFFLG